MTVWGAGVVLVLLVVFLVLGRKPMPGAPTSASSIDAQQVDWSEPFMEHPEDFDNAVDAMSEALVRLQRLRGCERWLEFSAQGQGGRVDSYHFAELRVLGNLIDSGDESVDPVQALDDSGLDDPGLQVVRLPSGFLELAGFSPRQMAILMDAIFRGQMGIRPHAGERDDYAMCAEW